MKRFPWMALVLTLASCTALMRHEPITKAAYLPCTPDMAYQQATQAMARMGAEVTVADPKARTLSGKVHNAVILTVTIRPASTGATVEATGTVMPNKIAVGTFDEVDHYLTLLR